MMKKRIITLFFALLLCLQLLILPAAADNTVISVPASAYLGNEITVTITLECTSGSGKIAAITGNFDYDDDILECISAPLGIEKGENGKYKIYYQNDAGGSLQEKFTFTFKGKKAGTGGLYVSATITDTKGAKTQKSQSTSVKIVDKNTLSGNAKAKEIIISAGKLVPSFNPDITSYNVNVNYSVKEVLFSVTTQEAKATIQIEGDKEMKVGNNTRTIIITAPNGTQKKYQINIYRGKQGEVVSDPEPPVQPTTQNPYKIPVSGKEMYMVTDYAGVAIPNGFDIAVETVGEVSIKVLKDIISGRIVVYATDFDGLNGLYYLYDREVGVFYEFRYMESDGLKLIAYDYNEEVPTLINYTYTAVNVGGYTVNGFVYKDPDMADFVIFYAENTDGIKSFYRFDTRDKTAQRAVEFINEINGAAQETITEKKNIYERFVDLHIKNKIVVIAGLVVILAILVLIIIFISKILRKADETEKEDKNILINNTVNVVPPVYLDENDDN